MFARYFAEIALPRERVEAALLRSPVDWIPGLAASADDRGQQLLAEVGVPVSGHRLAKAVAIELGDPVRLGEKTLLPMRWRATTAEGLFPIMDGDLEVAPLGASRTQLAMSARYEPPLGAMGRAIDRAVLHRVAEATIKDFVDRVARTVEELAVEPDPT